MRILPQIKTSRLIYIKQIFLRISMFFFFLLRLITAFDLHKTLKHLLKLSKYGIKEIEKNQKCRNLFQISNKKIRNLRGKF